MEYNVGMKSRQYTIRSIPPNVDKALRHRAQKTGKSLNEVVLDVLASATGASAQASTFNDLDWFIGQKSLDPVFDKAMDWLDSVPKEL
jgi:hypothetical protein